MANNQTSQPSNIPKDLNLNFENYKFADNGFHSAHVHFSVNMWSHDDEDVLEFCTVNNHTIN